MKPPLTEIPCLMAGSEAVNPVVDGQRLMLGKPGVLVPRAGLKVGGISLNVSLIDPIMNNKKVYLKIKNI